MKSQFDFALNKGATFWFTGLSGAGKSTLSSFLKKKIDEMIGDEKKVFILDGDVIRTGLNKDLGFTAQDRTENIRRISEVAKLFAMSGQVCFVAFISPYSKDRDYAKSIHQQAGIDFFECHIAASLEVCEERDVKGLYKKAREGIIKNFTGISDPYEEPKNPDLRLETGSKSLEECSREVIDLMVKKNVLQMLNLPRVTETLVQPIMVDEIKKFEQLEFIDIGIEQLEVLHTISEGWAFPLKGFMREEQLLEVLHFKNITDDLGQKHLMPVPLTLHVDKKDRIRIEGELQIAIRCKAISDQVLAVIDNPVFYPNRQEEICARVYGTLSPLHPKIKQVMSQGELLLQGSKTRFLKHIEFNDGMDQYRLIPKQIREQINFRKADAVFAFYQEKTPLNNGHLLMFNQIREELMYKGFKNPILLLHLSKGGPQQLDDEYLPLSVRVKQILALFDDGSLKMENTILAIWPSPFFQAGPVELLWHAVSRINAQITHFIAGKDIEMYQTQINQKGKKDQIPTYYGLNLLNQSKQYLSNIELIPYKETSYHKTSEQMRFIKEGNYAKNEFQNISMKDIKEYALSNMKNKEFPKNFMSDKALEVLVEHYTFEMYGSTTK